MYFLKSFQSVFVFLLIVSSAHAGDQCVRIDLRKTPDFMNTLHRKYKERLISEMVAHDPKLISQEAQLRAKSIEELVRFNDQYFYARSNHSNAVPSVASGHVMSPEMQNTLSQIDFPAVSSDSPRPKWVNEMYLGERRLWVDEKNIVRFVERFPDGSTRVSDPIGDAYKTNKNQIFIRTNTSNGRYKSLSSTLSPNAVLVKELSVQEMFGNNVRYTVDPNANLENPLSAARAKYTKMLEDEKLANEAKRLEKLKAVERKANELESQVMHLASREFQPFAQKMVFNEVGTDVLPAWTKQLSANERRIWIDDKNFVRYLQKRADGRCVVSEPFGVAVQAKNKEIEVVSVQVGNKFKSLQGSDLTANQNFARQFARNNIRNFLNNEVRLQVDSTAALVDYNAKYPSAPVVQNSARPVQASAAAPAPVPATAPAPGQVYQVRADTANTFTPPGVKNGELYNYYYEHSRSRGDPAKQWFEVKAFKDGSSAKLPQYEVNGVRFLDPNPSVKLEEGSEGTKYLLAPDGRSVQLIKKSNGQVFYRVSAER